MTSHRLPFWHFFHAIEKELSYERWINKYLLFLNALRDNHVEYDDDWTALKKFCKFVYLQNYQDEERFNELLDIAIAREKELLTTYLSNTSLSENGNTSSTPGSADTGNSSKNNGDLNKKDSGNKTIPDDDDENDEVSGNEPIESSGPRTLYYKPPVINSTITTSGTKSKDSADINFLMTDEYFPVSRRQMIKGWQFLRYQEKGGFTTEIDIPATVQRIAREGLFTEPKYNRGLLNREDTLIIFADYRGSMTPFHELTDRLIETAHKEGGHPRAPVFYFQNYPSGYVYKKSNFSEPVKLKEALLKSNRNSTLAIVISDGGAARGNTDPGRLALRKQMTSYLLDALKESCAHTLWLNPMPAHRWKDTAAEFVGEKGLLMAPIIDHANYNFQDTLRTILRHTKEQL